jgi:transcription initiation factor TFIID TATA-box-binding protein
MIDLFDFEITVENVVLIGSLSEGVDLSAANTRLEGSKCSWQRFPGLSYKLKSPFASFLLFRNGKFVCTGVKTKTKGETAITNFLNLLKTEGIVSNQCTTEYEVKNLVASINIAGASISLQQFTNEFDTIYEPEKFPAAIYKTEQAKATFLVFITGKLVCSGIADEETLKQTVKKFYQDLVEKKVIEKSLS